MIHALIKIFYILLCFWGFSLISIGQTSDWVHIHNGNKHFKNGDYTNAEISYRKALKEAPQNSRALFNLGDTFLAQNNPQEAMKMYQEAAQKEDNKIYKAMAFHNMGYIYHKNDQYKEAIDYYKEALRNNPKDNETRYNLALCQKQQAQQDSTSNNQPKEEPQNENKPEENQNSNQEQQNDQSQPNKNEISDENAERLLNLSKRAEQQTRDKLNRQKAQPIRKIFNKNW